MSTLIATSDLPAADRFDHWRSAVTDAFPTSRPERFDGRMRCAELGALTVTDTSRAYTLALDDPYRQLVFMLPRRLLHLPEEAVAGITDTRVSGRRGVGALLSALLVQLAGRLDEIGDQGFRLGDNIVDLLATLLAEHLDAPAPDARRRTLTLRVRAYIERHLDDPDLSPDTIAAAPYVSSRHLYSPTQPPPGAASSPAAGAARWGPYALDAYTEPEGVWIHLPS
ncbi:hypothetical protein [Actinomadura sp. NPDC000929]|uniref:AraC-like ligand-binding domain-containing protein n=1 Tax=Actinomadura sp. NPDC000929 TaxID=3154517 RepID=UPI00339773FE